MDSLHEKSLLMGTSNWKWPNIQGIDSFRGTLLHSAAWDQESNLKDKRIAVIGNGSSGIQLVTALQPGAPHIAIMFCQIAY